MRFARKIRRGIPREDVQGDLSSSPATSSATAYTGREASDAENSNPDLAAELSLVMSAARVSGLLIVVALALVMSSFAVGLVWVFGGPFVRLFYVGADLSLPSWYSALLLALASVLLATITLAVKANDPPLYARRWAALAAIFAYLACDEMLRLHERMADTALRPTLDTLGFVPGGLLYYPWVIAYAPLVVVFALAYFGFWRALPVGTRKLFLAAGAMFVGGALGVELFNAWYDSRPGGDVVIFIGTHVEEALEMLGVIVFVYALVDYLCSHLRMDELRLRLAPGPTN